MSALAVALSPGAGAAPKVPQASPNVLAAQSAAGLVASRPASIYASKDDAFIAHSVISTRDGLQYVPYDRTYKGLPVYGGDFVVVTNSAGKVLSTSAAQDKVLNVATSASQTGAQAAATARAQAKGKTVDAVSSPRKVVLAVGTARLTYETVVSSHAGATPSKLHVFTDAKTGAVAYTYDEVREGTGTGKWNGPNPLAITTSGSGTSFTMTDPTRSGISCRDFTSHAVLSGTDDVWGNGVGSNKETGCVDALWDVQHEWSMLSSWLGRNGINGSGGGYPIYMGLNDVNAYWDGTSVSVGHNNAGDWISELDVLGHEFGHAVDNFTPGGIGSSAVAEFTGDVFGALTEAYTNEPSPYDTPDYTVGEEVNLVGSGPIRYMYNPSLAGDPNCYSSSIPSTETHSAAGPGNHWFYLLAEGTNPTDGQPTSTTCNGSTGLVGIGIQTAGKIFYNAMLAKTTGMTYFQYRTQTLNAAKNLTPGNCTNFNKVKAAWDAVSVPAQTGDPTCTGNDLWFIKTRNTGSGRIEVHNATAASGYTQPTTQAATWMSAADQGNGTFQMVGNDLWFIKTRNTGTGRIELFNATAASGYTQATTKNTTRFSTADQDNGTFQMVGNDLWFIKTRNTGTGRIEVFNATAASGYTQTTAQKATWMSTADQDNGTFQMVGNDLWFIKTRNTSSGRVELYTASAVSGYTQAPTQTVTRMSIGDQGNGWFQMVAP